MIHSCRRFAWCLAAFLMLPAVARGQAASCNQPDAVCAARDHVYMIAAFDPFASAVRIAPDLLITNRHVIADAAVVKVTRKDGKVIEGRVVASSYEGDLVLIRAEGLANARSKLVISGDAAGRLFTVGGDFARKRVRAFPPGRQTLPVDTTPYARLHHSAYGQIGTSGGAVVNEAGQLVAIVASGGEGRFEAVPAREIAKVRALSGDAHRVRHGELGTAYRRCMETLERLPRRAILPVDVADRIVSACRASQNRQLFDLAARALGRGRRLARAIALSETSVRRDGNAVNARLALVVSLHIAGRYKDELPHLEKLLEMIPEDGAVHRFAIQAGKWTGDLALANRALALLRQHNPAQAEAAERFLKLDRPPPARRK